MPIIATNNKYCGPVVKSVGVSFETSRDKDSKSSKCKSDGGDSEEFSESSYPAGAGTGNYYDQFQRD